MDERVKAGGGEDHTSLELEMTIAAADEGAPDSTHYIRTPTPPTHPHPHPHTGVWLVYRPVYRLPSVYVLIGALGINKERSLVIVLAQIGALLGRVEVVAVCLADGHTVLLSAVPVARLEGPKGRDEGWVLLRHPRVAALLRLVTETAPETLLVQFAGEMAGKKKERGREGERKRRARLIERVRG